MLPSACKYLPASQGRNAGFSNRAGEHRQELAAIVIHTLGGARQRGNAAGPSLIPKRAVR